MIRLTATVRKNTVRKNTKRDNTKRKANLCGLWRLPT